MFVYLEQPILRHAIAYLLIGDLCTDHHSEVDGPSFPEAPSCPSRASTKLGRQDSF